MYRSCDINVTWSCEHANNNLVHNVTCMNRLSNVTKEMLHKPHMISSRIM